MEHAKWHRVSPKNPCRVCQKPDWCTFSENGAACCMRVQSDIPMKNGGFLHKDNSFIPNFVVRRKPDLPPQEPTIDFHLLWNQWNLQTPRSKVDAQAIKLGVSPEALWAYQPAWSAINRAWGFPMRNSSGQITGIRLRAENGEKWAVKGSKQGMFLPQRVQVTSPIVIVEGPTDAAAGLSMGFFTIGRASCSANSRDIMEFASKWGIRDAIIISDNDDPGLVGSARLRKELNGINCAICTLPAKDLREFVKTGGTKDSIIDSILHFRTFTGLAIDLKYSYGNCKTSPLSPLPLRPLSPFPRTPYLLSPTSSTPPQPPLEEIQNGKGNMK